MLDDDLIKIELPDKVTYTLIVVLISYLFKMIFDVIYRLRKMECKWGSLCFCKSQFKDGYDSDEEVVVQNTCPACHTNINLNINKNNDLDIESDRRSRLKSIMVDD